MAFLIGVIIFIVFILILLFYFKYKIRSFFYQLGFPIESVSDIVKEARLEDEEVPKSLSSMDRIYLEQIKKDFIDISIDELEKISEKTLIDCYLAFDKKDTSKLKGKIKSFVDKMIEDYKNQDIHFKDLKIHKTVISNYKKDGGVASIYFSTSYQYYKVLGEKNKKVQDRVKTQFIYIYDKDKVPTTFSIHCPNCGSPIHSLGEKKCSYCGGVVKELYSKTFICSDIVRY